MRKNQSAAIILTVIVALGLAAYFSYQPIMDRLNLGLDLKGGLHVVLQAKESETGTVNDETLTKSVEIMRNRIDQLGVKEPQVYPQGTDRIVIDLAGVGDPEEAVNIIKNTAQLEFQDETGKVLLTGANLEDAQVQKNSQTGEVVVTLKFDDEGASLFAEATKTYYGKPIAIVLDDVIISAPTVGAVITDGKAEISGGFTVDSANQLALQLRSGALPVSFEIMEKRTVEPTLGADSLSLSIKAGLLGLLGILVFMAGYYRLAGLVADVSIVLYALLVLGTMAALGAVLTLPGIAAFVLSIGMAVDANIIIYEHIKEEMRVGKSTRAAIDSGFSRALWTILDSQLTTLIAALVLMWFGTGPIKGFAVTLSIGIVSTLVVALGFTRYFLNWCADIFGDNRWYGV